MSAEDPVVVRRARIGRIATRWKRGGYGCLLLAVVAFVAGLASDFPGWLVTLTIVALVAAIVILPVPIIVGYGVRAAARDERGGTGH